MSASRCGALYFLSGFRTNFLFRLSRFPRGLPGAEFFYENYVCYMMFGKNSSVEKGNLISYLTYSKHPSDVIKRRGKVLVDNICCPRYLNLFFLNATRFTNKSNAESNVSPSPQTVCQNTIRIHIVTNSPPEPPGKR